MLQVTTRLAPVERSCANVRGELRRQPLPTAPERPRLKDLARRGAAPSDRSDGFTLIELMIVVVILGILAAIAIPNYMSMTNNSRTASCISNQRNLVPHASLYAADNGISDAAVSVNDLYLDGRAPSALCECPLSDVIDQSDYTLIFEGGVVIDVVCLVAGDDHPWDP